MAAQPHCRVCATRLDHVVVDLGMSPPSNSYLKAGQLLSAETFFPLRAFVCEKCFLVQLPVCEAPETIFGGEYLYFSSYSTSWLRHCESYAEQAVRRFGLTAEHQVVELASNDGYLLQYFKARGVRVLGVEPAPNVARVAIEQRGIPTEARFFNPETAADLRRRHAADLIVANNVLAHVPDLHGFVEGMRILLAPAGVITVEFPHLQQLIEGCQFDTIYHEHFSYLSFAIVTRVFAEHGLRVFDVEELPTHGGSLRVYAGHPDQHPTSTNVAGLLEREQRLGYQSLALYAGFRDAVNEVKRALLSFLIEARRAGKRVVAYGAAAKGNTLLNYCGVREDFVDFVADMSPHKQGHFLPGTHIPIVAPAQLEGAKPDYVLILPWNLRDEIATQLGYVRSWGGKFVRAIPRLEVW